MERVFYFSGYRMRVFEWHHEELVGSHSFEPDESGLRDFETFLAESIRLPARLLVDLIEEEFRRETIPHVNVRDRRRLIDRLLERHYRDRTHVHAEVIGRSRDGRRDDQLLISALTNSEVLKPWMERLQAAEVSLAGIWSLPLITHRLLRHLKARGGHSLVITRQIRSSLRNTYFNKGKLMLSRLIRFDNSVWDQESGQLVADHMERGALEIDNFLVNQRLLGSGENLEVYCLLPESQIEDAREFIGDTDAIHYHFFPIEQVHKSLKIKVGDSQSQRADTLFSYLCTRESVLRDHYATKPQRENFYQYFLDNLITHVQELGTLLFVTAAVLLALNSMQLRQKVNALALDTSRVVAQYETRFAPVEERLASASAVHDSVVAVDDLRAEALATPQAMFAPLGEVLGDPMFAGLYLDRLEWHKYDEDAARELIEGLRDELAPQRDSGYQDSGNDYEEGAGRRAVLHLHGRIDRRGLSYAGTVERMQAVAERLGTLNEVSDVLLLKTPVDVRAGSRFSDQLGGEPEIEAPADDRFELLLLLEAQRA
ncbi:MAG: hypothetical protein QNI86_13695 [Halieaceae bacterium]|nr:hypothetical protein [Halieaceae bacterium]